MTQRNDDLAMLDDDILAIKAALENPDGPIELRASLKLELSILIQMRLDIGSEQGPKLSRRPN